MGIFDRFKKQDESLETARETSHQHDGEPASDGTEQTGIFGQQLKL